MILQFEIVNRKVFGVCISLWKFSVLGFIQGLVFCPGLLLYKIPTVGRYVMHELKIEGSTGNTTSSTGRDSANTKSS